MGQASGAATGTQALFLAQPSPKGRASASWSKMTPGTLQSHPHSSQQEENGKEVPVRTS